MATGQSLSDTQAMYPILKNPMEYEIRAEIYAQFERFINIEREKRASVDIHFRDAQRTARWELLHDVVKNLDLLKTIIAPIWKLPDKILTTIFWYTTRRPERVIMNVCDKWRFLARRTPSLWTHIIFGGSRRRLSFVPFAHHLSMSDGKPLDVALSLKAPGSIAAYTAEPNEWCYSACKSLLVESPRIRTLRIFGSPGVEHTLFFPDRPIFSLLTNLTLDFENITTQLASEGTEIFSPNLRVLNLLHPGSLIRYLSFTEPLQYLHTLKIHTWNPEHTELLFCCPSLQTLIVDFRSPDDAQDTNIDGIHDVDMQPVGFHLPQLTKVFLDVVGHAHGPALTRFFRVFSAPNLTKLWMNMAPDLMARVISLLPSRPESLTYLALNPLFTNTEGPANPWIYGACVLLWKTFPNINRLKIYPYRLTKCPWAFTFSLLEKSYYWDGYFACRSLTKITFCRTLLSRNIIDLIETRMSAHLRGELPFPLEEVMFKKRCTVSDRLLPAFLLLQQKYREIKFTGLNDVRVRSEDSLQK
ncbi:hypothetical protein BU17DRAFT_95481 [Hysterangium stoloniferum]|nr:hypothetical protein BU17DRAFT_95481 [Hysterangium stoloniferum]